MKRLIGLLLAALLGFTQPALAGIGNPFNLGGANGTGSATVAITTGSDCPVGDTALVTFGSLNSADALVSVSDNAGTPNTWTLIDAGSGQNGTAGTAYAPITSDLASGKVITVTGGSTGSKAANAICVAGLTTSPVDKHNNYTSSGTGSTSATSVATGTLGQSTELVVGVLGTSSAAISAYVPGGSFAAVGAITCNGTNCITQAWQIVSSTASVASAPSWTGSASYSNGVISLKGVVAGGASAAILGVGQ